MTDLAHVGAMLEDLTRDVRIIAEGHGELIKRFDRLETKVDKLDTKVDRIDMRVEILETKVDKLETKVDEIATKVDKLETKVDEIATKLDENTATFEVFAGETRQRLGRIETHLELNGVNPTGGANTGTPRKRNGGGR